MLDSDLTAAPTDHPLHIQRCKDASLHPGVQASSPLAKQQQPSPNHVARASSLSRQLSWRRWFKSKSRKGFAHLPPNSGGQITPCSSTGSTCTEPPASCFQLQATPSAATDVCDGEIDVSSCCISRCTSSNATQQLEACSCGSKTAACASTPAISSSAPGNCPAEQQQQQQQHMRRRTTGSVLAACAARAHRLQRRLSHAVLKQVQQQHPAQAPTARDDAHPRLNWLPAKGGKAPRLQNGSLPPVSLNSKPNPVKNQQRQCRAASLFEATGRENIRFLLGPHAVWGSVTRYKMLLLAEQVHEAHLQTVLNQTFEQVDWAGEPAWEDDFSGISSTYGQRVRQHLFWWGGALAHLRWRDADEDSCCAGEEPAAKVSVVVGGEDMAGTAAKKEL